MNYDAILVLGRGVYKDGSIPESAKSTVEKAVELYNGHQAERIVFSGKWTYKADYIPPTTEARAMANYARTLGLPEKAIHLEEKSYTTVSNAYFIKTEFLIPNNWHRVLLVSVYPMDKRAHKAVSTLFGSDYVCDLVTTDFVFPSEILKDKEAKEKEKREYTKKLYESHSLKPGDHKEIRRVTDEDLDKNWRGQTGIPKFNNAIK